MSVKKFRRNEDLKQFKKEHPKITLAHLGTIFGITKQRVHQIMNTYTKE